MRLIQIFGANGITGWRRGCALRIGSGVSGLASGARTQNPKNLKPRPKNLRRVRSSGRVRPDFVFRKVRVAVFVDGCFWHGCPKHGTQPKTNAPFWRKKITNNKARDRRVNHVLRGRGWKVVRIWEHELRRKNEARLLRRLAVVCGTKPGRAETKCEARRWRSLERSER